MQQKKTKIICTISDLNCEVGFLRSLYENGMNVVRINSAHATLEGAQKIVDNVRAVSDKIAILIDTKGPEVRLTGMSSPKGIDVRNGDILYIYDGVEKISSEDALYTNCSTFVHDVPVGSRILIDDGSVELLVRTKTEERLECNVRNAGVIKGKKSINVPNVHISLPSLTEKDRIFVHWAIENDIDFIAHSFVRTKKDVLDVQEILDDAGSHIKIIAKIENQQGIDNLEEILIHSYGAMIARGDLGVEIPAEKIPLLQKAIVQKCREYRKPVIIATQMLHSMIENPRPTRAEVTDIANAIFQRTDAIMLSGETASGKYPVESVTTMRKIASEVEDTMDVSLDIRLDETLKPIAATLARNLVEATMLLPVKAIIFDTWTGRTGRYLAEFRPKVPVYAMCYQDFIMREMALTYGIHPYEFDIQPSKEDMVKNALKILVDDGKLVQGDLVGFIGGSFNDALGASYMEFKYV
ncbi:MAG: pyruvate kinase [Bacteroidales bacterium]|nr:pyruvate kinase [Bacteroidales bacterium]